MMWENRKKPLWRVAKILKFQTSNVFIVLFTKTVISDSVSSIMSPESDLVYLGTKISKLADLKVLVILFTKTAISISCSSMMSPERDWAKKENEDK